MFFWMTVATVTGTAPDLPGWPWERPPDLPCGRPLWPSDASSDRPSALPFGLLSDQEEYCWKPAKPAKTTISITIQRERFMLNTPTLVMRRSYQFDPRITTARRLPTHRPLEEGLVD